MAQLSLIVWPRGRNKKTATEGYIVFKLSHKGKRKLINTDVIVNLNQYKSGRIDNDLRLTYKAINEKRDFYTMRLVEISDREHLMSIEEVKEYMIGSYQKQKGNLNVLDMLETIASEVEAENHTTTYPALFRSVRNSLRKWWGKETLFIEALTYPELKNYERWLKQQTHTINIKKKGKIIGSRQEYYKPNTISIHFRCIRRLFNWAIDNEMIEPSLYPFHKFRKERKRNPLRVFDTRHRDLTLDQLRAIRDLDLSKDYGRVQQARDMFMLSFYLVGMNLVDIWNLDLRRVLTRHIQYTRQKTQKGLQFTLCDEAMPIILKYFDSDYNFLIRKRIMHYESFRSEVNKGLKYVGDYINVPDLTFYFARHTWSTLAETLCGVSEGDIKLALSHGAKTVTGVYINKDRNMVERIDKAHRKVLDRLYCKHLVDIE